MAPLYLVNGERGKILQRFKNNFSGGGIFGAEQTVRACPAFYITRICEETNGGADTKKRDTQRVSLFLERLMGVEPTYAAWEAAVLPMNYSRVNVDYYNSSFWKKQDEN